MANAHISVNGNRGVILIDGHPLQHAIRAFTLKADVNSIPTLELELNILEDVEVDGQVRPVIPPDTCAALVALGWTPPETT